MTYIDILDADDRCFREAAAAEMDKEGGGGGGSKPKTLARRELG